MAWRDVLWALPRRVLPERLHRTRFPYTVARDHCRGKVLSGPFEGMRYIEESVSSAYFPKLLGVYEMELHDALRRLIGQFETVVDVGAAEGYYACGFAFADPACRVVAFEQNPKGQRAIAELASRNGLESRIEIRGFCSPPELETALGEKGLLVMDVEGAERELLDPEAVPALLGQTILVELHDFKDASISEQIRRRFEPSHEIEQTWAVERTLGDLPFDLTLAQRIYNRDGFMSCLREGRPPGMSWYLMTPFR